MILSRASELGFIGCGLGGAANLASGSRMIGYSTDNKEYIVLVYEVDFHSTDAK